MVFTEIGVRIWGLYERPMRLRSILNTGRQLPLNRLDMSAALESRENITLTIAQGGATQYRVDQMQHPTEKPNSDDQRDSIEEAVQHERERCLEIIAAHRDVASDAMTKHLLIRLMSLIATGEAGS